MQNKRTRALVFGILLLCTGYFLLRSGTQPGKVYRYPPVTPPPPTRHQKPLPVADTGPDGPPTGSPREQGRKSLPSPGDASIHPIDRLVRHNQREWTDMLARQSQTLQAAVKAYTSRYKIPPPPHFDTWFKFAQDRGVQLIDEYDTIYHDLLPFWGLEPATIRSRVRHGMGIDNNAFVKVFIRDGRVKNVESGEKWQRDATTGMMKAFVKYLPDMDLAFNIHDEPRVVVPQDSLRRLVQLAVNVNMPKAASSKSPRGAFSSPPTDLGSGKVIPNVETTLFNEFAHQATWLPGTLSCPPDSPAMALEAEAAEDDTQAYGVGELGFVYNQTAFSDVCNSPSLAHTHGAFERPNAFKVVHELFPVFSQSKLSSYNDILYPSPWYFAGKAPYKARRDMSWTDKASKLWWVGSTTGGYSRNGGWKRQHRQLMVAKLNDKGSAKILHRVADDQAARKGDDKTSDRDDTKSSTSWQTETIKRSRYEKQIDVHFSGVGQCDEPECNAMRKEFEILANQDAQNAWQNKFLLDMDGNAFSGRFYTFLRSFSLPFKMAVFREWHQEWLRPWVHYVPLSLRGDDVLEAVRYFAEEDEGRVQAHEMAMEGREWAARALRNEDFEVWFFRLLLEYGRIVDDDRENIGYGS